MSALWRKDPLAESRCVRCREELEEQYVEQALEGIRIACPFCDAKILPWVKKCNFCGEWVNEARNPGKGSSSARGVNRGIKEQGYDEFMFKLKIGAWFFGMLFLGVIYTEKVHAVCSIPAPPGGGIKFFLTIIFVIVSFICVLVKASDKYYKE